MCDLTVHNVDIIYIIVMYYYYYNYIFVFFCFSKIQEDWINSYNIIDLNTGFINIFVNISFSTLFNFDNIIMLDW